MNIEVYCPTSHCTLSTPSLHANNVGSGHECPNPQLHRDIALSSQGGAHSVAAFNALKTYSSTMSNSGPSTNRRGKTSLPKPTCFHNMRSQRYL